MTKWGSGMDANTLESARRAILGNELASVTDGNRPGMLDLRPRKGQWLALPYSSLREVTFLADGRPPLRIEFSSYVVEIEGSNLKGVYLAVVAGRAMVLSEVSSLYRNELEELDEDPPNIDRITVRRKTRHAIGDEDS